MRRKANKLLSLDNVSVIHLNANRGYLTYLERCKEGKYKVKGIVLDIMGLVTRNKRIA